MDGSEFQHLSLKDSSGRGRGSSSDGRGAGSGEGSSGSRGRGRGASRGRPAQAHLGTIHRELFTRPSLDMDKRGSAGVTVPCQANFVPLTHKQDSKEFYQYHVGFSPEIDSKQMRVELVRNHCAKVIGDHAVFDGMILYVPDDRIGSQQVSAPHPITGDQVVITFRESVTFGHNDPQAITVYNLLVRDAFKEVGYIEVARNYYDPGSNMRVDKHGVEVWPGYETAVRLYEDSLMLCIENRFKVLRTETVYAMLSNEFNRVNRNVELFQSNVDLAYIGQTVLTMYNNRMHRITKIEYNLNPASKFLHEATNRQITFAQYFKETYNLTITDMKQPLIVSEGKPKQPGEAPQPTYLVPELCKLTGITDAMRKDRNIMKAMAECTRLPPECRKKSTEKFLREVAANEKVRKAFAAWSLDLGTAFVDLPARQLPPEELSGAGRNTYTGTNAEWARDVRRGGNFRTVDLKNWIVVCSEHNKVIDATLKFIDECKKIGRMMGMNVDDPMKRTVPAGSTDPVVIQKRVMEILSEVQGHKIDTICIILDDDSKTRYDVLKKTLCLDFPVPSQMILFSTLAGKGGGENKNFGSIVLKILLQINCKMGGAVWKVNIPLKKTMIVGYDLYHDSTMKGKTVGACVSSYDADFTKWYSQTQPHENPTQLGDNLRIFIKKGVRQYWETNNKELPERIIVYRDGCGDGQIPYVRDQEVRQVQQACAEISTLLNTPFPVKIAFLVITKKVNMRVFRVGGSSSLINPSPGTVVDSVVTRPERYDFYLVPQFVNQGTVTPVCYNILFDDTGMTPDQHQRLAFKLCHLYYNWQGTVRVPAPCQYAHKLAFLVAQSLHTDSHRELRDRLFFL